MGTLGRYRLVSELGRGGMGVVYRAVVTGPEGFQRTCVIKRLVPDLAENEDFVQGLAHEARLCGLLNHPNIVQVFELGHVGRDYFLAMEYVDGLSLREVLWRGARANTNVPPGVACFIATELASALHHAHTLRDEEGRALEIVHRDVSPANVMLGRTGAVKLLDFGIAKAANHVRDEHTKTGTLKGKFSYMSPEQANGMPVDARSDLFALGIVLWETLMGKRLFRGVDDLQTLRLVREAKIVPTGIDPELDAIVLRMLAINPQDRYHDCEEVGHALSAIASRYAGSAMAMRRLVEHLVSLPIDRKAPNAQTYSIGGEDQLLFREDPGTASKSVGRATGELVDHPGTLVVREPPRRKGWWRRPAMVALGAAAALGLTLALALVSRGHKPVAPIAVPPVAAAPAPPAPPQKAHLEVSGPAEAELLIDGQWYGMLPMDLRLPMQSQRRVIEVRQPGYQPYLETIAGDQDARLAPSLKRKHKSGSVKHSSDIKSPFGVNSP